MARRIMVDSLPQPRPPNEPKMDSSTMPLGDALAAYSARRRMLDAAQAKEQFKRTAPARSRSEMTKPRR
jgi:hypothetical protein